MYYAYRNTMEGVIKKKVEREASLRDSTLRYIGEVARFQSAR